MNREEYLSSLFRKNKYCNCENLVRLSCLEKERKELSNICDDLFESLFEIHEGNKEVKKIYEQKTYKKVNLNNEHNLELNSLIKHGKLKLFYHNEKENYEKQPTNFEKGVKLLKKSKKKIITVHCYDCDQQIAALSIKPNQIHY